MFSLNILLGSLRLCPLVLSLCAWEKKPTFQGDVRSDKVTLEPPSGWMTPSPSAIPHMTHPPDPSQALLPFSGHASAPQCFFCSTQEVQPHPQIVIVVTAVPTQQQKWVEIPHIIDTALPTAVIRAAFKTVLQIKRFHLLSVFWSIHSSGCSLFPAEQRQNLLLWKCP